MLIDSDCVVMYNVMLLQFKMLIDVFLFIGGRLGVFVVEVVMVWVIVKGMMFIVGVMCFQYVDGLVCVSCFMFICDYIVELEVVVDVVGVDICGWWECEMVV